jgi:hypothetical protein
MQLTLTPTWTLTTDHAASSYGHPVLVSRATGEAYGPADIVSLYPSWGMMMAADAVRRAAKLAERTDDEIAMIRKFAPPVPEGKTE